MSSLRLSDVVAKRNLKRVFWESLILIAFTLLGGTSYHLVVHKSLPGPRHVTPLAKTEAELNISLEISLEEALGHHTENSAIFIDARSYPDYKKGHIKGSLNISPQEPEDVIEE
ncbi:MAG: rhodanese-like domain-containing protein, partial [Desulfatiglandales bacterium]